MKNLDDMKILRVIGKSTFSQGILNLISKGPNSKPHSIQVLKQINLDNIDADVLQLIQHDLWYSRSILHENILVHNDAFVEGHNLNIIYEYMQYGSCVDIIESYFKCGLPESTIAYILKEVLKALIYLHKLGYVHRGLKASHILISASGQIKICSHRNMISCVTLNGKFGKIYHYPTHDTAYLPWFSPEILQQNMQGYDTKSDIYSLGITACELANGYAPFTDMPVTKMLLEKLRGLMPCLLDKTTLFDSCEPNESYQSNSWNQVDNCSTHSAKVFSSMFHDMVSDCLQQQPCNRPSASELINHNFFLQASDCNLQKDFAPLVPVDPFSGACFSEILIG